MIEIKTKYPYINQNGIEFYDLIETYAEDENGIYYYIIQNETNLIYSNAVDKYPNKYTYKATTDAINNE